MTTFTFIYGPTGASKTKLVTKLYNQSPQTTLLVSVDSRKMIQDLNIGTNKAPLLQFIKEKSPQLLGIDIFSLLQQPNIAQAFLKTTPQILEHTSNNVSNIIIWGGSALYLETFLNPKKVLTSPPPNATLRNKLSQLTLEKLQTLIRKHDPHLWNTLNTSEQKNRIRLIRRAEIILNKQHSPNPQLLNLISAYSNLLSNSSIELILIDPENRELYYQALKTRIHKMFQQGWLTEIQAIFSKYDLFNIPFDKLPINLKILGYRQILQYINKHFSRAFSSDKELKRSLSTILNTPTAYQQLVHEVFVAHKRYSKLQLSWVRRFKRLYPQYLTRDQQ